VKEIINVKWVSDSIISVTAKSKNVTHNNEDGVYNKIYMISSGGKFCVFDFKAKKTKYCPIVLTEQRAKEYQDLTKTIKFIRDKKNRIVEIFDNNLDDPMIAKIKY